MQQRPYYSNCLWRSFSFFILIHCQNYSAGIIFTVADILSHKKLGHDGKENVERRKKKILYSSDFWLPPFLLYTVIKEKFLFILASHVYTIHHYCNNIKINNNKTSSRRKCLIIIIAITVIEKNIFILSTTTTSPQNICLIMHEPCDLGHTWRQLTLITLHMNGHIKRISHWDELLKLFFWKANMLCYVLYNTGIKHANRCE